MAAAEIIKSLLFTAGLLIAGRGYRRHEQHARRLFPGVQGLGRCDRHVGAKKKVGTRDMWAQRREWVTLQTAE